MKFEKIGVEPWQKVGVGHFFLIHIQFSRNEALIKTSLPKLVETTNLWQLYWDKNTPARIR